MTCSGAGKCSAKPLRRPAMVEEADDVAEVENDGLDAHDDGKARSVMRRGKYSDFRALHHVSLFKLHLAASGIRRM